MPHEGDGTLDKLLGLRQVFARVDPLVEGAGVHSDANGDSSLPSRIDDGVNAIERANVSGVDANAIGTATSSLDGKAVVEVYVRNDGDWRLGARLGKSVESIGVRNRYANDFTAELSEVMDLRKRRCGIGRGGGAHGLDRHGSSPANGNVTYEHLVSELPRKRSVLLGRKSKVEHANLQRQFERCPASKRRRTESLREQCPGKIGRSGRASRHPCE